MRSPPGVLNGEFEQIDRVGAENIPEMREISAVTWTSVLEPVGSESVDGR
jgi:hypothetical protein